MQQKQMMLLFGIVAVVVIVIVAAVLMMSGPKAPPGYPPGYPGTGLPSTGTPGTGVPIIPSTPGTGTPGTSSPAGAPAIGSSPMECDITSVTEDGQTITMNVKTEPPTKLRAVINMMGMQTTMLTADGVTSYMNNPMMGNFWIKMTAEASDIPELPDANALIAEYQNPPPGVTYNCRPVGDIPDSEFQVPPGAEIRDSTNMVPSFVDYEV